MKSGSQGLAVRRTPISVAERVAALPCPSPRDIDSRLEDLGYRGQRGARRSLAVLAWRHVRRLRRLHLDGVEPSDVSGRDAYLLLGPTGCGKTHLVELVFGQILGVPSVVVDITQFSETGYVGHDASTVLTRLVEAADGDPAWASCGVVCLDEFDKIAGSVSSARFAGGETTKDVSGWGVQRSLLTLLSAPTAEYAPDHGFAGKTRPEVLSLSGVTFVACGAFSRLRGRRVHRRGLGFAASSYVPPQGAGATEPAMLERYQADLTTEGLDLALPEEVLEGIVEGALRRGHGARGLRVEIARLVEDVVYEKAKGANG